MVFSNLGYVKVIIIWDVFVFFVYILKLLIVGEILGELYEKNLWYI